MFCLSVPDTRHILQSMGPGVLLGDHILSSGTSLYLLRADMIYVIVAQSSTNRNTVY